jgi:ABC-type antimicrobial peptide transport system permease subunit
MSLDFALKDFYRKKKINFSYVLTIALVIALAEFLIYFSVSLGLNRFLQSNLYFQKNIENDYYFSGAINVIYTQFNNLILLLVILLAFIVIVVITSTFVIQKKRDIAIMKALGSLPDKLYGIYLLEAYIIFLSGYGFGLILGLISFGIYALIFNFLGFTMTYSIDLFYTPLLFFSCFVGLFFITGFMLRKIGKQKVIRTFSGDIPYNLDASKNFTFLPRRLSSLSLSLKIAIINTIRRKGDFIRFMIIFSLVFLIIFTLVLGTFVLNTSTQQWIKKSQGEDIIVIGHEDVIDKYSEMYEMFSDPEISVDEDDINFTDSKYLFNRTQLLSLEDIDDIRDIEKRLITFCDVEELDGYYYYTDEEGSGGYRIVGQQRKDNIPIIGVDPDDLIQEFEIEGRWFDEDDAYDNMTIADGLAYNFFDYPLDQSMRIKQLHHRFHISGVVIDSFYSGYAGYIDLKELQQDLNYTHGEINISLLKLRSDTYEDIKDELKDIIKANLGSDFTCKSLDNIFEKNLEYLSNLSLYPIILITIISMVSILSLYNYQKAGLLEKAKDFLIMRAIGTKRKLLKKILFLEALFVIIPSILISLGFGMLINSLILIERAYLPPLYVPIICISIIFGIMVLFILLSLIPIMKKIDNFSIKNFEIY